MLRYASIFDMEQFFNQKQLAVVMHKYMLASDGAESLEDMIARLQPTFGLDDAVVLPWCGMHLCIETDGYCHT